MTLTTAPLTDAGVLTALSAVDAALASVPTDVSSMSRLSDSDLVAASTRVGRERDALGAVSAVLAGEIARRSAPEFGSHGLAQRNGFRTPIEMVKVTTRVTGREASTAVRAGTLLVETANEGGANPVTGEVVSVAEPWLKPVATALSRGILSLAAADAIRAGLGAPNSAVGVDELTSAVEELVRAAQVVAPDKLHKLARAARTELDASGIGIREAERREQRSLRLVLLPDGMGRLIWTMDPATLAVVQDLYDRATSPKLGGVRFVGPDAQATRDAILADVRAPQQLASDAFAHLLGAGADADPSVLIGSGAPIVRLITVAERPAQEAASSHDQVREPDFVVGSNLEMDTDTETGRETGTEPGTAPAPQRERHGYLEGHHDAVSQGTLEHAVCTGTVEAGYFDSSGELFDPADVVDAVDPHLTGPLDEARENRSFTKTQKAALAARDGGCRWPGCNRPPSWCEAHHIRWWTKHHGRTHVDNGILLCKHHHLLLHNNEWDIQRGQPGDGPTQRPGNRAGGRGDGFWLVPPADIDAAREPRLMPSRSPAWNEVFA